jgi:hypothetical protein
MRGVGDDTGEDGRGFVAVGQIMRIGCRNALNNGVSCVSV